MTYVLRTVWTSDEFMRDIATSKAMFRRERLLEPVEAYSEAFDLVRDAIENLIEETVDLSLLEEKASELLQKPQMLDAMRYLAGPPISRDDLLTLIDSPSVAPGVLRAKPELVKLLVQTIRDALDRNRFPWVSDRREPTGQSAMLRLSHRPRSLRRRELQLPVEPQVKRRRKKGLGRPLSTLG